MGLLPPILPGRLPGLAVQIIASTLLVASFAARLASADCTPYQDYVHGLGALTLPCQDYGSTASVALSGTHAYLIEDRLFDAANFHVLDLQDSSRPVLTGSLEIPTGFEAGIASRDDHALVAGLGGLAVIDASIPASPKLVAGLGSDFGGTGSLGGTVVVEGNYAFVSGLLDTASGFITVDISDLEAPHVAGDLTMFGADDFAISNGYAFAVSGWRDSLAVIDIRTPETPRFITALVLEHPYRVAAEGSWVYVVGNDYPGTLTVIDVSDPRHPVVTGELAGYYRAEDIVASPGLLYLAISSGLAMVDTSHPESPTPTLSFPTRWPATSVSIDDEQIAVASHPGPPVPGAIAGGDGPRSHGAGIACTTFDLVDVAPSAPAPIAGSVALASSMLDIGVDQDRAYVSGGDFFTVDVSDLSLPTVLAQIDPPGKCAGVAIEDTLAYVAAGDAGLQIVDISDPAQPQVVGGVDTPGHARGVAVRGSFAYIADDDVQIIAIANPRAPEIVGHISTPGTAAGIVIEGSLGFVPDWCGGLHVLDLSAPLNPRIIGTVPMPACGVAAAVEGSLVAVATLSGVDLVDVSDPHFPSVVGSLNTLGTQDVAIRDRYVYAADYWGLFIIDAVTPSHPRFIGYHAGSIRSITVTDGHVFAGVALPAGRLELLPLQCPRLDPVLISSFEATSTDLGIELEWTVFDDNVAGFLIARSPLGGERFIQLSSLIAAEPHRSRYTFRDSSSSPGKSYRYRLHVVNRAGEIMGEAFLTLDAVPPASDLRLSAVPNPSSGAVAVRFQLPRTELAELALYDLSGRRIRRFLREELEAGSHSRSWDLIDDRGARVPAGIYFLRLEAGAVREWRKLAVVR